MQEHLNQEHLNTEAGIEASKERHLSRADFFKVAALTGGAAVIGETLFNGRLHAAAASDRSPRQDQDIFDFFLSIEYLQAAFYSDAIDKGALTGELARYAEVAGDHEQRHVSYIRKRLGAKASQRQTFDFGDTTSSPAKFASTAIQLEELGLRAYVGQGANMTRHGALQVARIASVEGRHAAWIRDIQAQLPAPFAADRGADQQRVATEIRATGFTTGGA